jgi:hypothetical protein
VKHQVLNSWQSAAIFSSSSRVKTFPHGFDGVQTTMPRVFGPNAARSASKSIDQSGVCSGTNFGTMPRTLRVLRW